MDSMMMQLAMMLSRQARILSPPNPWVGCVITQGCEVVGTGYTQAKGQAHAEIMALRQAGDKAFRATLYTTLEPCSHWGSTPPCVESILEAGIKRVVIGIMDPDPLVAGKGIAFLQDAGVEVNVGIENKAIEKELAPYLYHRTTQKPYVVLKNACSIDGQLAAEDGTSQWITDEGSRVDVHAVRAESQAIMIGSLTALNDKPALTVRHPTIKPKNPLLRVVLDSRGIVPAEGPLFEDHSAPTLIFTTPDAPHHRLQEWDQSGVEVIVLPILELDAILEILGNRGIIQLLVEGGHALTKSFLREGKYNQILIYVGNCLLGPPVKTILQAPRLQLDGVKAFDTTVRLSFRKP